MITTVQDLIDTLQRFKERHGDLPVVLGHRSDPWTYDVSKTGELFIVDPNELKTKMCHITDYSNNNLDDYGWKHDFEGNSVRRFE